MILNTPSTLINRIPVLGKMTWRRLAKVRAARATARVCHGVGFAYIAARRTYSPDAIQFALEVSREITTIYMQVMRYLGRR